MFQSAFTMIGRCAYHAFAAPSRRQAAFVLLFFAWPVMHASTVTLAQMTPSTATIPTPMAAAPQPLRTNPATISAPVVQVDEAGTGAVPPNANPTAKPTAKPAAANTVPATISASNPPGKAARWALALHGGALDEVDKIPTERRRAMEKSLTDALRQGRDLLAAGGSSLDAVERVVRTLEDDPLFNAGKGAVYNAAGRHELDASIMDGRTKACGAVAGVSTVKNPVSLARLVMSRTRHVLLMGAGAEQFADEMKVERVDNRYFDTDYQFERWQRRKAEEAKAKATAPDKKGTVGCVALDQAGQLAAATSTGGLTNKRFGRVGDSPIIGAGTYADNATCAVSCTGTGEEFIRHGVAHDVHARVLYKKQPLAEAVSDVLRKTLQPDDGALIAVGADGQLVADFNTDGLSRGLADSMGRFEVKLGKQ